MQYLDLALRAVQPGCGDSTSGLRDNRPVKRDSRGQTRKCTHVACASDPFSIPFGPNLAPVQQNLEISPRTQTQEDIQPSPLITRLGPFAQASRGLDNSDEDCQEIARRAVTTNDLLDCLVHPDIIVRVTELLLKRARDAGKSRSTPFC